MLGAARTSPAPAASRSALTDCLNFGNPEKPEIALGAAQAIEGIAEAAEALGVPVVSGNVSLYNETDGRAIPPTPVVGCVGLVPDVRADPARLARGRRRPPRAVPRALDRREAALVALPLADRRRSLLARPRRLGTAGSRSRSPRPRLERPLGGRRRRA